MIVSFSSFVLSAVLLAQAPSRPAEKGAMEKPASAAKAQSIYDFTVKDIDGKEVKLDKYRGDVLMVINTASQ